MITLSKQGQVYALFAIVVLAAALGSLTQTAMNSMLEEVDAEFSITESIGQWVTTLYMLVVGITVPAVTYLSQKMSQRVLVLATLVTLLLGSIVSGLAPTFLVLLAGRALQAISTGITLPLLQAIAMTQFPPGKNGTAMGVGGIAMGFAPNIGPLIGSLFVGSWGWRVFYVLLGGCAVLLIACTWVFVNKDRQSSNDAHLEVLSLILSTLGFGGLLLGFSNAANMAVTDVRVWLALLIGVFFLLWFFHRQKQVDNPLINLDIFKSARYCACFAGQSLLFASFMGITLIIPLFVQGPYGGSAYEAGLVFIPATVMAIFVNPLAGILADKIGARKVIIGGSFILCIGSCSMILLNETSPLWLFMLLQGIRGMGVSALVGPLASFGMSELPRRITMDGSAFATTVRQAFASFGTALMVLITSQISPISVSPALPYQLALSLSALFALAIVVCAIWKVR